MLSLFFVGCAHNVMSQPLAVSDKEIVYEVSNRWNGRVYSSLKEHRIVIRTQAELKSFTQHIPKNQIQMTQPAPPSDDPLHNGYSIDFSKSMMIVVGRFDNMYAQANIDDVMQAAEELRVVVSYPPLGDTQMLASMSGVGTYTLIEVPQTQQKISFVDKPQ